MNNLVLRICTAIVGVAIFAFMLFYRYETFAVLFMVLNLLALNEFYRLIIQRFTTEDGVPLQNRTASITYFLSGSLLYLSIILTVFVSVWFMVAFSLLLIYFFIQHQKSIKERPDIQLKHKVIGWIYITWPFILVTFIAFYNEEGLFQPIYVLGIFLLIWGNDVFAYFIGKRFGKTPLASKIKNGRRFYGRLVGFYFNCCNISFCFACMGLALVGFRTYSGHSWSTR